MSGRGATCPRGRAAWAELALLTCVLWEATRHQGQVLLGSTGPALGSTEVAFLCWVGPGTLPVPGHAEVPALTWLH